MTTPSVGRFSLCRSTQQRLLCRSFSSYREPFLQQLHEYITIVGAEGSSKELGREFGIDDDQLVTVVTIELRHDLRQRGKIKVELETLPCDRTLNLRSRYRLDLDGLR